MKGKKVYLATITLGEYDEAYELMVGVYENKDEIKDKIRQDDSLLERLEENWYEYGYVNDYPSFDDYLEECFEIIEEQIIEMTIE